MEPERKELRTFAQPRLPSDVLTRVWLAPGALPSGAFVTRLRAFYTTNHGH